MRLADMLKKQLAELNNMRPEENHFLSLGNQELWGDHDGMSALEQKFYRWRYGASVIIEKHISPEEKKNFKESCPQKKQLKKEMSDCAAYLEELIEKIQKEPGFLKGVHENKETNIPSGYCNEKAIISGMHKEVAKIAKDRIKTREYKGIILDVCISLNKYIQKKADIAGLDGATLMETALSPDNPKIILSDEKAGEKKFKEEQKGFMFLFSGAMKTIRNKAGHHHKLYKVESLQDALEVLGFFSFLFKIIDSQKDKQK